MMEVRIKDIRSAFISCRCRSKKSFELFESVCGGDCFSIGGCELFFHTFILSGIDLF